MKAEQLERQYSAGEVILARGTAVRELYVIRAGRVVLKRDEAEEPIILEEDGIFGEAGGLLGQASPYVAKAEADVTLLALGVAELNRLCAESPEFSARLIRHLAEELQQRECTWVPADAGAPAQLETLVCLLLKRYRAGGPRDPVATRLEEIAKGAGLAMLDAYRGIQWLLDHRLLRLVEDRLTVLEPEELDAIIEDSLR